MNRSDRRLLAKGRKRPTNAPAKVMRRYLGPAPALTQPADRAKEQQR